MLSAIEHSVKNIKMLIFLDISEYMDGHTAPLDNSSFVDAGNEDMDRSRRLSELAVPRSVLNLYKVDDDWSSTKTFMLLVLSLIRKTNLREISLSVL